MECCIPEVSWWLTRCDGRERIDEDRWVGVEGMEAWLVGLTLRKGWMVGGREKEDPKTKRNRVSGIQVVGFLLELLRGVPPLTPHPGI